MDDLLSTVDTVLGQLFEWCDVCVVLFVHACVTGWCWCVARLVRYTVVGVALYTNITCVAQLTL